MLQKRRVSKRKHNAVPSAVSWGEAALMFALTHATLGQHLGVGGRTGKVCAWLRSNAHSAHRPRAIVA